jgi:hypothetical protein
MWQSDELIRRAWARIARLGQQIVPGSALGESIDIGRLICPLRYDVWVRIEFIRLLRDEWALYRDDLSAFLDRAPARAYYVWFRDVRCVRYHPQVARDPELLESAFMERVHKSARLWHSVDRDGFDVSTPIRLMSGRSIRNVNGKAIRGRYFAGDGCHRIACLHLIGRANLEPAHYEVSIQPSLEPMDNTAILIDCLPIGRAAYLRYLSHFYCDGAELDSADGILHDVASRKPDLLPELESVLAFDLPKVRENG